MEDTPKVDRKTAEKDVNKWLDYKKVSPAKRTSNSSFIENMIEAIMDGTLVLKDDMTLEHELKFQTEGTNPIKSLTYKPRLKVQDVLPRLKTVKSGDGDGRLLAYVAALTDQNSGVIEKLDSEDYSLGQAIAIFFT